MKGRIESQKDGSSEEWMERGKWKRYNDKKEEKLMETGRWESRR